MSERWHLRATAVATGEPLELWIADGVIRREPVRDAVDLAAAWVLPGLVDAHCHIGLDEHGAVSEAEAERQAVTDRDAGALLLRDAGSPADTRWMQHRHDLPELIRAGRHIARPKRYIRNYAAEVEPADLVAEVERQVANGDGWIKLVGDWIDRDLGDLAPLWPAETVRAAIERAHELGARVTVHAFGEQAVAELVAAGVDGVEHGTGLLPETITEMARREVALVPTLLQVDNFPGIAAAGEAKYPRYAAHMRALYERRVVTWRTAYEAGVPIYAGTDAGGQLPHGIIGTEVAAMAEIFGAEYALGAGSWRAREWLGRPYALADGDPADLVAFTADPRRDPAVLRHPAVVLRHGIRYRR